MITLPPADDSARSKDDPALVHFIDYEYAVPSPAAFDIANHFAEWGGYDCDYGMMPTRSVRRQFLTEYVQSYSQFRGVPESSREEIVDRLFHDVDRYRGMPGLYWYVAAVLEQQSLTLSGAFGASSKPRSRRSTLTTHHTPNPALRSTTPGAGRWMDPELRPATKCP